VPENDVSVEHLDVDRRASMEAYIRAVWAEILEVADVTADDTFFDLGGESISATLCANRLQADFRVQVPVSLLLDEHTTATVLAAHIGAIAPRKGRG
jgi:acyl carrier protein